jgi:hypothetical protein
MRMRTRMQRTLKCWCFHDKCSDFVSGASVQCALEGGRRTQDHDKRSNAQTVMLQCIIVWAEPLAVRAYPQDYGLGTGSKSGTPQHRHNLS